MLILWNITKDEQMLKIGRQRRCVVGEVHQQRRRHLAWRFYFYTLGLLFGLRLLWKQESTRTVFLSSLMMKYKECGNLLIFKARTFLYLTLKKGFVSSEP